MSEYYQINLRKVIINQNGLFLKEEEHGMNIIVINLIYPRPGVPLIKSLRTLDIKEAEKERDSKMTWDFSGKNTEDKAFSLIFKEVVAGEAYLEFIVTAIRKRDDVEKFLFGIIGGTAKILLGSGISALVANSSGSIIDSMKPQDKESIIGYAILPFADVVSNKEYEIPLKIPKTIELKSPASYDDFGRITSFNRITLAERSVNGTVNIYVIG